MVFSISLGARKYPSSHLAAKNTNNDEKNILIGIKDILQTENIQVFLFMRVRVLVKRN